MNIVPYFALFATYIFLYPWAAQFLFLKCIHVERSCVKSCITFQISVEPVLSFDGNSKQILL